MAQDTTGLTQAEIAALAEQLSDGSRRVRQDAAKRLAQEAKDNPQACVPYIPDFIDALNRPESQTRWECLDVLTSLVSYEPEACGEALPGAELALFDEENTMVRLWAMIFLCQWGKESQDNSIDAWPLINEAIRCYHGDMEFQDMLTAVLTFSQGDLAPEVKKALIRTMTFDAENAKEGLLQRKAQRIIDNLK